MDMDLSAAAQPNQRRSPGRPAREPMERIIRLMVVLSHNGQRGVSGAELIKVAGFGADAKDPGSQLSRDINHLRRLGWTIENVGDKGTDGHYRMLKVDNRLKVQLTPEQMQQLYRAAALANRPELAQRMGAPATGMLAQPQASVDTEVPVQVTRISHGLQHRCLLRFAYAAKPRQVAPAAMRVERGKWYLQAQELGSELVKTFALSRITELELDAPGSAPTVAVSSDPNLNPLLWQKNDPEPFQLRCRFVFEAEVKRVFGEPKSEARSTDGAMVELEYVSTNNQAVFDKLIGLDTRVVLAGSERFRAAFLQFLQAMAE